MRPRPGLRFRLPNTAACSTSDSGNQMLMIQLVFRLFFVFNNMARFVFRFVFSTGTCFQQHPSFVFRFVFGYLCSLLLIRNNIPGSFLKISIFCPIFPDSLSKIPAVLLANAARSTATLPARPADTIGAVNGPCATRTRIADFSKTSTLAYYCQGFSSSIAAARAGSEVGSLQA